ncbi:MAG: hypothetical protein R3E50_17670 [Halioglobus sp.]
MSSPITAGSQCTSRLWYTSDPSQAPATAPRANAGMMPGSMVRQPNAARDTLLASCVTACSGRIAAAGTNPGITAISKMPPPMPMTAARPEVRKTMGTNSSSLTPDSWDG